RGGGAGCGIALIVPPRRFIGDEPGGMKRARHIGDGPFEALMIAQFPPECLAHRNVLDGIIKQLARSTDAIRAPMRPAGIETAHRDRKSLTFLPEQILARHPAILENDLGM